MERNCATYWGPKTERNEILMRCADCVFEKKLPEEFPCRDCHNKRHFKRKGKSTIHYDSMTTTNNAKIPASNSLGAEGLWIKRNDYFVSKLTPDDIKNVIFNDPATIVFWSDGTKTVVKTQDGEPYNEEKGFAMAVAKKAFGNEGNYYNVFKKWLPEEEEEKKKNTIIGKVVDCSITTDGAAFTGEVIISPEAEKILAGLNDDRLAEIKIEGEKI